MRTQSCQPELPGWLESSLTREVSFGLPAHLDAAAMARRTAQATLRSWHLPDDSLDDVVLVLSELVSNAIRYGGKGDRLAPDPDGHPIHVRLRATAEVLSLAVADASATPPHQECVDVASAEGGRGLLVIESLAKRWGWLPRAGGGKIVWTLFALN